MNVPYQDSLLSAIREFFEEVSLPPLSDELSALLLAKRAALFASHFTPPSGDAKSQLNDLYSQAAELRDKFSAKMGKEDEATMSDKEDLGAVSYLEAVEDYLDAAGLTYPDEEREDSGDDCAAILYGTRYSELLDVVYELMLEDFYLQADAIYTDTIDALECDTVMDMEARLNGLRSIYFS